MSQDPSAGNPALQSLDPDELEVEILILAKSPKTLEGAAAFLSKRGWPTKVMGNISMGVEAIAEKRPDIVLISFNHPSPAIKRLPELIAQTFNIICIGYVENPDPTSANRLASAKVRYKIFGRASGPNFERGIRRILAEKLNLKLDDKISVGTVARAPTGALSPPRKSWKELTGASSSRDAAGNLLYGKDLDPEAKANLGGADLVGLLKQSLNDSAAEDSAELVQSPMEKAVVTAIKQSSQGNVNERPVRLTTVTRLGVFPYDSGATPGYVVIAIADGLGANDSKYLKSCEFGLQGTFNAMGVGGKIEAGFWLDIPETAFWPWCENSAVFSLKSHHLGLEVGAAFFQSEKPLPKMQLADEDKMYAVKVEDISTSDSVTFRIYLHLRENRKYYLYLRPGRLFLPEQKKRLSENKTTDIYIKAIEHESVRMFFALSFLKENLKASQEAA